MKDPEDPGRTRLDKWLWAARFFKTRNLAKLAVDSGHVRYGGERCKVSKDVAVGAHLQIRQGWDDIEVEVLGLSDQRRGAPEARLLCQVTAISQQRREQARLQRQLAATVGSDQRPTKKQRRDQQRFRDSWS